MGSMAGRRRLIQTGRRCPAPLVAGVLSRAGGGGVPRAVVGRSDAIGGEVLATPIPPKDLHAPAFPLLGLDPHALMYDRQQRPYPVAGAGEVRPELLA